MKHKKGLTAGIALIVIIAFVFIGYNIYRYPASLRSLSDRSLNDLQVEDLRQKILSQTDIKVLVAFFSYSGTTRKIANALSKKTGKESDIDETMPTFLNSCDGFAVYGERRISGINQLDGWLSELGLIGG